jgi:hypothetical protein
MMDAAMSATVAFLEEPHVGFALTILSLLIAVVWLIIEVKDDEL